MLDCGKMQTARRDVVSIFASLPKSIRIEVVPTLADEIVPQSNELTRRCKKCGIEQAITEFYVRGDKPHLRKRQCRTCLRKTPEQKARQDDLRALCPERDTLKRMIQRCHNPNNPRYGEWGGKGIRVCDEWRGKGGFERFLAHVGKMPTPEHSIDRYPNKDGNYEPGNVRWATRIEQMNNIHRNVLITANNKTLTLREWARLLGTDGDRLDCRYRAGWTHDEIINVPFGQERRKYQEAKAANEIQS